MVSYRLLFQDLEDVTHETDLGVCIDKNVKFSDRISAKLAKANKLLGTLSKISPQKSQKIYTSTSYQFGHHTAQQTSIELKCCSVKQPDSLPAPVRNHTLKG